MRCKPTREQTPIHYLSIRKLRRMIAKVGEVVELARKEFGMIWSA